MQQELQQLPLRTKSPIPDENDDLRYKIWLPPGRRAEVKKLGDFFRDASRTSRNTYVICGMGGSGKTQICKEFVSGCSEIFKKVFWIDASTTEYITGSLESFRSDGISVEGQVKTVVELVLKWISVQTEWLLVFDGAELDVESIIRYLPPGDTGNILFSTRNPEYQQLASKSGYTEIGQLTAADALCLFMHQKVVAFDHPSIVQAEELVRDLHFLPMAVCQARSLVIFGSCSYSDYIRRLAERRRALASQTKLAAMTDTAKVLYSSWEVARELLKVKAATETRDPSRTPARHALLLLIVISYWHYRDISFEIFDRFGKHAFFLEGLINRVQHWFEFDVEIALQTLFAPRKPGDSVQPLRAATNCLLEFNLIIEGDQSHHFSIHPLIQAWLRHRYNSSTTACEFSTQILSSSITYRRKAKDYIYRRTLLPHIRACQQNIAEEGVGLPFDPNRAAKFALVYWENGDLADAETLEEQVLDWKQVQYGIEDESTLHSMADLALTYEDRGRWSDAERLNRECLELRKKILGVEHMDTLTSMHNLASTLRKKGQWDEASEIQQQVFDIEKRTLGEEHPNTLASMHSLASTYARQSDRMEEAEELNQRVLELRKKVLGEEHPDTLTSMHNLASIYYNQGRLQNAVDAYRRVILVKTRTLGLDHPDTLSSRHNLACALFEMDQLEDAIELMTAVIHGRTAVLGETHPYTTTSMDELNQWKQAHQPGTSEDQKEYEAAGSASNEDSADQKNGSDNVGGDKSKIREGAERRERPADYVYE